MSDPIVEAINDLTRVVIAVNSNWTKSEAVRKMSELSMPSGRIAAIMAMSQPDVSSIISKAKKKKSKD